MPRAIVKLSQHETQIVHLTVTLRPQDEADFYRMSGVAADQMVMIRDRTTRGNVRYHVYPYRVDEEDEAVRRLVERKQAQYPMPGQIIVYYRTVQRAISLSEVLHCRVYHRKVGDKAFKRQILDRLVLGQNQVFTATNALGLGINQGSIRVVIHIGVPRRLQDFTQESGRTERDGFPSKSIMMQPHRISPQGR